MVIETAYAQTPILRSEAGSAAALEGVLTTWRRIRGVVEAVTPTPPGLLLRDSVEEVVFREVTYGAEDEESGAGDVRETRRLPRKFVAFAVMETVDFPEE